MTYNYIFLIFSFGCAVYFSSLTAKATPKLACYFLTWPRYYISPMSYLPENIPVELCDELVYFHADLNETTFDIDITDRYAGIVLGDIKKITDLRLNIYKVIISVGGWNRSLAGFTALSSPVNRQTFVTNTVKFMQTHNFNGLLIDWTYPGEKEPTDKATYVDLVKDLRKEFKTLKYKLAITGPNDASYLSKGYDIPELSKYVDSFHVKSHEMWGFWESTAFPHNPLYGVSINTQKNYSVKSTMDLWVSLGAPKKKLFVGMTLLGNTLQLLEGTDGRLGSYIVGKGKMEKYSHNDGEITYYEICAKLMSGGLWKDMWESEGLVPYAFDVGKERKWVSYESPRSAFEKAKYVRREGFGGLYISGVSIDDFRGLCGPKHGITKAAHAALKNLTL